MQALNFGFMEARRSEIAGINGKLSEYHAAIGLAELDCWPRKRADFARVTELYRDCATRQGLVLRLFTAPAIASCYTLYHATDGEQARSLESTLVEAGVDHRLWYGLGLHREPYFADAPHDPLPGVDALAPCLVGLPTAPDLAVAEIEHIVGSIAQAG